MPSPELRSSGSESATAMLGRSTESRTAASQLCSSSICSMSARYAVSILELLGRTRVADTEMGALTGAVRSCVWGSMNFPRLSLRSTPGSSTRSTALRAPRLAASRGACVLDPRLASDSFPDLACGSGQFARALRLALGLLQALARTLELFFRDAHALLGDLCLQPR